MVYRNQINAREDLAIAKTSDPSGSEAGKWPECGSERNMMILAENAVLKLLGIMRNGVLGMLYRTCISGNRQIQEALSLSRQHFEGYLKAELNPY